MLYVITVVSLLALCHGLELPKYFQTWLNDPEEFNSMAFGGSRIIGGQYTTIEKYPFAVSLQRETVGNHYCSGAIVNEDWILTTAQCALPMVGIDFDRLTDTKFFVRAGSSYYNQGGTVHEVAEVVFHPGLVDLMEDDYDIALVKLNNSLVFSDVIKSITLPKVNNTVTEGQIFTFAGWGAGSLGGSMTPQLKEISLPAISKELCIESWGERVTHRMFCASQIGLCTGDGGSPCVIDDVLVGIASYHWFCSSLGHATVYTDVSTIVDWVHEISGTPPGAVVSFYSLLAIAIVLVKNISLE